MSLRQEEMQRLRDRLKELETQEEIEASVILPQATPPDMKRPRVTTSPRKNSTDHPLKTSTDHISSPRPFSLIE